MGESVTSLLAASSTETRFRTGRPGRVVSALSLPDGRRVVAKRYSDDRGALAYRSMNELWRSSFGERRRPPGLPRPLGYDASRGVLLMEWIDGRPWLELGAWDARRLRDAVSLLADLH